MAASPAPDATGTMAASSTAVMEHFLVKKVPKQTRMPSWDSSRAIHLRLNVNAASVPSYLGGGQHGHLRLTIGGVEYQTFTGYPFAPPENPGVMPPRKSLQTTSTTSRSNLPLGGCI
eukprot:3203603-Ditylum_brightwellii.AAC.2